MLIKTNENITIFTQKKVSIKTFINNICEVYSRYKENHLVINFITDISLEAILSFLDLSNTHRNNNKSFVIVSDNVNIDDIPEEIVLVPTLQEAYDIIEMEAIERDLG